MRATASTHRTAYAASFTRRRFFRWGRFTSITHFTCAHPFNKPRTTPDAPRTRRFFSDFSSDVKRRGRSLCPFPKSEIPKSKISVMLLGRERRRSGNPKRHRENRAPATHKPCATRRKVIQFARQRLKWLGGPRLHFLPTPKKKETTDEDEHT